MADSHVESSSTPLPAETKTSSATPSRNENEFPLSTDTNGSTKRAASGSQPPLWKIHELPAPIRTFPLPSFYPSNPLSLFHVVYAWISQVVAPPKEPSVIHVGYWSAKTCSVHITEPKSIRALWEQGFYGKGHLSRTEPNWLKREQARRGTNDQFVAEEFTVKRREERQQMKWDRARKEQELIEKTRREETWVAPVGPLELLALPNSLEDLRGNRALRKQGLCAVAAAAAFNGSVSRPLVNGVDYANARDHAADAQPLPDATTQELNAQQNFKAQAPTTDCAISLPGFAISSGDARPRTPQEVSDPCEDGHYTLKRRKSVRFSPKVESTIFQHSDPPTPKHAVVTNGPGNGKTPDGILTKGAPINPGSAASTKSTSGETLDQVEASLSQVLGTSTSRSEIVDREHLQLMPEEVFFLTFGLGVLTVKDELSESPLPVETLFKLFRQHSYIPPKTAGLEPDDPFLINYAAYHHFRSLGWVVRTGIKFGCDWLLYFRGPAFTHAEFAVIVVPSYSNAYWKSRGRETRKKPWHWLHALNRVESVALKTLILVYVDVPPPPENGDADIPSILKQYTIREVMVKRWQINRSRDRK